MFKSNSKCAHNLCWNFVDLLFAHILGSKLNEMLVCLFIFRTWTRDLTQTTQATAK